jgi:GrpB-like predicted nucleotidyltransferase (UPF0157 family)
MAADYAVMKYRVARQFPDDRIAYNDAKTPWIAAALRDAEAWATAGGWRP